MEFVDINGRQVEIHIAGNGPPLVFLHGEDFFAQNAPFLDLLAKSFRIYAPRHPGFGQTPLPDGFRTVSDLGYHTLDLLERLDLSGVTLLGSAMGGWIALDLCAKSSQRVSRLALLGSCGVKFGGREDRDFADIWALPVQEVLSRTFFNPDKALPDYTALTDEQALEIARDRQSAGLFLWKPYMHDPALRKWLARIRIPSLVLWGENDGIATPDYARNLAAALPDATLRLLPNAGHYPQIEQPGMAADAITQFARA